MSVTGQVGHLALAKQTAFGTPNVTGAQYKAVKITGDSLAPNNNMLVAEGEIGTGRDVSQAVPGGFSAAGAVNGNLRARSAAVFLDGVMGTLTAVAASAPLAAYDDFDVADDLPSFTVEKKVGTTGAELLTVRYSDVMINTLNISAPAGAISTFSAGMIACGESYIGAPIATIAYPATSDELLVFHGGRVKVGNSADGGGETLTADETFQSLEVVINNNIAADEYTIRPSRFLRSLTEGIRSVETNMTIVFENFAKYQQYTYGATGRTAPGYSLYMGALEFTLANWQLAGGDSLLTAAPTGGPTNPQGVNFNIHKLAFAGFPVALTSGRIAVTTNARALKPATGNILDAQVLPTAAGF